MKNPNEDHAYEQLRQKLLDQGEVKMAGDKLKIGSCSGVNRPERFSHVDKWKDIPFVEEHPSSDGLLMLWGICTTLVLLLSAYLIWGPK